VYEGRHLSWRTINSLLEGQKHRPWGTQPIGIQSFEKQIKKVWSLCVLGPTVLWYRLSQEVIGKLRRGLRIIFSAKEVGERPQWLWQRTQPSN